MLKHLSLACGVALLLAGSAIAGTDDARLVGEPSADAAGSGAMGGDGTPGDTLDEPFDERGSGDAGMTGSGATGEAVLDPTVPAERMHPGHRYDEQGNPIPTPPLVD